MEPTLTPKQESALTALLSQPTVAKAAEKAGCSERAIYLWLKEEPFRAAYSEARAVALQHATSLLQKAASTFVAVLLKIATDENASDTARVSAAVKGLEMAFKGAELEGLAERLRQVEQALADLNGGKGEGTCLH